MKSFIICDASFDVTTHISGVAGSVVVGDSKGERHSYVLTEIESSNEAELYAIQFMLLNLEGKLDGIGLGELSIYTDSQSGIDYLTDEVKLKKASVKIKNIVEDIKYMIEKICPNGDVLLNKVKSHVHEVEADHFESHHNIIDKMAKDAMKSIRDPILYPKSFRHHVVREDCVLSIDNKFIPEFSHKIIGIVKELSKKEYNVRFNVTNNDEFNKEVLDEFNNNKSKNNKIEFYSATKDSIHDTQPDASYERGLDRSIMRAYCQFKKIDYQTFIENVSSGIVTSMEDSSRLVWGGNDEGRGIELAPLIINLSNSKRHDSINYWLNEYAGYANVTLVNSIKEIEQKLCFSIPKVSELRYSM